ncbi:CU044_5270 family protein [Nonomuraea wenchangensis]|uniref:CU044_5270 family protein n=2 Tax=Nonomuraea wenchangensis TaxID=568860 RepID=UPI003321BED3
MTRIHDEFDLVRRMRAEVPVRQDLSGVERRLAELRTGGGPARSSRRHRLPRLRWGLALAAACVLGVGGWQLTRDGAEEGVRPAVAHHPATTTAPATVLERAALAAASTMAAEPGPDQWFYRRQTQHMPGGDLPTYESWHKLDGTRTAIRTEGGKLKVTDAERGPTHPGKTLAELRRLPTDPDALLRHFRSLPRELTPLSICAPECPAGTEQDVKAFGAIGWYMSYGPLVPPDTAAGMYRALAKIPNVRIERNATDGDGRTGIGVVLDLGAAGKGSYILDPEDYHYLGLTVERDGVTAAMSVLSTGVVDEPGRLP